MTISKLNSILIASLVSFIFIPSAFSASIPDQISSLRSSGSTDQAFTLAKKHLNDMEGDVNFDYAYGLAALDAGFPSQAVFALERVLQHHPDNLRARLELARGYFLLEQFESARIEFNQVLKAGPPENVQKNVQRYLDIIRLREGRYKTTSSFFAEFGAGHDDNVNSAPNDGEFLSLFGLGQIGEESLAQSDSFVKYKAGFNITHPVKPGLSLLGGGSIDRQIHQDASRFDHTSLDMNAGISYLQDRNNFKLLAQGQKYRVGGHSYRDMLGVTGEWRHSYRDSTLINLYAQGLDLKYSANELRDSHQFTLGLGVIQSLAGEYRPLIFSSLYAGSERATLDAQNARILTDRNMLGGRLGVQLTLAPNLSTDVSIQYRKSSYQQEDPVFFSAKRSDDYFRIALGNTWLFHKHWSLRADLSHQKNSSNIDIYEYDGNRFNLTFRYEF